MNFTKENKAGEQQPYIPAGNGKKSGQFTFKTSHFKENKDILTIEQLKKLLTYQELQAIVKYSQYEYGVNLNKKIRLKILDNDDLILINLIISAINKNALSFDLRVYRGIKVTLKTYLSNFYSPFITNQEISGSLICSTSRNFETAQKAAFTLDNGLIPIFFEITIPKGYKSLPIEAIALNKAEQEILLSKPIYKIIEISEVKSKTLNYKKIIVELKEKENEN